MTKLIWRNLLRNKRRTVLTLSSVALALLILCLLGAIFETMSNAGTASKNRLVVRHAVSLAFSLPEAYGQRLASLDHVVAITPMNWFQGVYKDTRRENFFPRFAVDPEQLLGVFPEYQISPEQYEAFSNDRGAFISGKRLAEEQGWQIGDRITIKGDIYPMTAELILRGLYTDPERDSAERQIYFHYRYVEEALGNPGQVGTYYLRLDNAEAMPEVIGQAEALFENAQAPVRVETEEAFYVSFMEMAGNISFFFGTIGLAIVVSIFLITANTMAMAARERIREMSVLRTLGFRRSQILRVVLGEALAVGVFGAATGLLLAAALLRVIGPALESSGFFFGEIRLSSTNLAAALAIGITLGVLAGLPPALSAARQRIVDGLRRV